MILHSRCLLLTLSLSSAVFFLCIFSIFFFLISLSPQCDPGVGVDRFFHAIYTQPSTRMMMLLGSACSEVTESLAKVVPYWNIVQVSQRDIRTHTRSGQETRLIKICKYLPQTHWAITQKFNQLTCLASSRSISINTDGAQRRPINVSARWSKQPATNY